MALGFRSDLSDAVLRVKILNALADGRQHTLAAICGTVQVSAGRAFPMMKSMIERDLIERIQLEVPRRSIYVLTTKGKRGLAT